MYRNKYQLFFALFIVLLTVVFADAQIDPDSRDPNSQKDPVSKGLQESLAKQRIDRDKKDFADLVERGGEALKISEELEKSYAQNNKFSGEDQKKLERLEKVVKKIRSELGGDDDDAGDAEINPLSVSNAVNILQSSTVKLADELKNTTRYTVSVVAVESSNMLLKAVRFLRFRKN